jgi:UDP-perosamine 4-acetyltransferase
MKPLYIIGTGSQARYVIDTAQRGQCFEVMGLAEPERNENVGKEINGVPVLCRLEDLPKFFPPDRGEVVVAHGNNWKKREIVRHLKNCGYLFATVISPAAYISQSAAVCEGAIINPGAVVMPNAWIGAHAVIHSHVDVEHDCRIGDYANLAPGVSMGGRVEIGEGTYVYTGTRIIPGIRIGAWAVVGAGATVIREVASNTLVVGSPARRIRDNTPG